MNFMPCDIEHVKKEIGYKRGRNVELLNAFIASGYTCVKVEGWTHCSASSCAASLMQSVRKNQLYHIKVINKKGEVYLINEILAGKL